ncbi:MAG: STAS domain-containing protein [Acidimicrobiia bacterium]
MPHRGWIVVAVGSPISPADLPALCTTVRTRLEHSGAEVVVIDLGAVGVADAVTIDAMARLALTARRLGRAVQLRDAPSELHDLLAFTGLRDVVELGARLPLVLQGETEEREEALDVEEEAELDDPAV